MKNLILISLFINVHADCNFGSNSELQNKVDQWSSGQLGQNDACYDIENWNRERNVFFYFWIVYIDSIHE